MNKLEQLRFNRNEINRLEEENSVLEKELLTPYAKAYVAHHNFKKVKPEEITGPSWPGTYLSLSEPWHESEFARKKEPGVDYVSICFEDSRDGDCYNTTQIPVEHLLNATFDEKDFETNRDREDAADELKREEQERKEFERLKEKYANN